MPPSKKGARFWTVLPIDSLFLQLILDTFVKKDGISHGFFLILTHNLEIRPPSALPAFPAGSRCPLSAVDFTASRWYNESDFAKV